MKVDIGLAVNKNQPHQWWQSLMGQLLAIQRRGDIEIGQLLSSGAATPDWVKNRITELYIGPANTAENRNKVANGHEQGDADAIFWIDDDTVPPDGALEALLERNVGIAAGVYHRRSAPWNPMIFNQMPNGGYISLWEWEPGEILHVDGVGMGCTVVRREVFNAIRDAHELFMRRATGTLRPVLHEQVKWLDGEVSDYTEYMHSECAHVTDQGRVFYIEELLPLVNPPEWWPYFAMEYQRTEDLAFCEMARACGVDIVVDTSVVCEHWGLEPVKGDKFRDLRLAIEAGEVRVD